MLDQVLLQFVTECLHVIDVEGIPVDSANELPSFYQAVSSLILKNEVMFNCSVVNTNSHFMFLINVEPSEQLISTSVSMCHL